MKGDKNMPYASLEKRKEYDKKPTRLAKQSERKRTRRLVDKEFRDKDNKRKAQWEKENPRLCRRSGRKHRAKLKLEVLTHYGPKGVLGCCWKDCPIIDLDMLSLDHKKDDGNQHLWPNGERIMGEDLYRWAKRNNYPKNLQTLCMNHQQKKKMLKVRKDSTLRDVVVND